MRRDLFQAADGLSVGEQIERVDYSAIERVWNATRGIRADETEDNVLCVELFARRDPKDPVEQHVAIMLRFVLMHSLVEEGTLDGYLDNEPSRKRVFAAVASLPCTKNDVGEAVAQRFLSGCPPNVRENAKQEIRHAGYDPDHPIIGERFIRWMCSLTLVLDRTTSSR